MELVVNASQLAESSIVAEQKKTIKFLGSQRKVPGLTLFEYDPQNDTLKPARYREIRVEVKGEKKHQTQQRLKLEINENCLYVQALNKKNAVKKIAKLYIHG